MNIKLELFKSENEEIKFERLYNRQITHKTSS
jgi:hypothetical protein